MLTGVRLVTTRPNGAGGSYDCLVTAKVPATVNGRYKQFLISSTNPTFQSVDGHTPFQIGSYYCRLNI